MPAVNCPPQVSRLVLAEDAIDTSDTNLLWAVMMMRGKEYGAVLGFA